MSDGVQGPDQGQEWGGHHQQPLHSPGQGGYSAPEGSWPPQPLHPAAPMQSGMGWWGTAGGNGQRFGLPQLLVLFGVLLGGGGGLTIWELGALPEQIKEMSTSIQELRSDVGKLEFLPREVGDLKSDLERLQSRLDGLEDRLPSDEHIQMLMLSQLQPLKSSVEMLDRRMVQLERE